MTRVDCAAFEGLARAVAGTRIPRVIETVHAAHMERGPATHRTCGPAPRPSDRPGRPEHRQERLPRGAGAPGGVTGRQPGVPQPLLSWRDVSRGGRRENLWRVGRTLRNGSRAEALARRLPETARRQPPRWTAGKRVEGACAALLRTAMVIFGTIGWPIKTHRDHRLRRRFRRGRRREFPAYPKPDRSLPIPVEDRPTGDASDRGV